jgi:hypothetical protein
LQSSISFQFPIKVYPHFAGCLAGSRVHRQQRAGRPGLEFSAAGMVMRDCRYASKNFSVMVKTSHYSNPAAAKDATKMLAGKLRAIPNDPDGAVIQEGQGDLTDPAVFYVRNGVAVELRVLGIYYKDLKSKDADLRDMQTKLAAIKRLQ